MVTEALPRQEGQRESPSEIPHRTEARSVGKTKNQPHKLCLLSHWPAPRQSLWAKGWAAVAYLSQPFQTQIPVRTLRASSRENGNRWHQSQLSLQAHRAHQTLLECHLPCPPPKHRRQKAIPASLQLRKYAREWLATDKVERSN